MKNKEYCEPCKKIVDSKWDYDYGEPVKECPLCKSIESIILLNEGKEKEVE